MKIRRDCQTLGVKVTLHMDREGAELRIDDELSTVQFVDLKMTAANFVDMLGGRGFCPATAVVGGLSLVGKRHEHKPLEFEMPPGIDFRRQKDTACKRAQKQCPEGWEPDLYFNSQDSFFTRYGKPMARCTIRRWVDVEVQDEAR